MATPNFCPGCGAALEDPPGPGNRRYPCRDGALATYCIECGTNWYMRDVGTRTPTGITFLTREMGEVSETRHPKST